MGEVWKPVVGFEDLYEVSNEGQVRSLDRLTLYPAGKKRFFKGKMIKPQKRRNYFVVPLTRQGKVTQAQLHRVVALAFYGAPPEGKNIVSHKDHSPANNRISNLEWTNQKENINKSRLDGRLSPYFSPKKSPKFTAKIVEEIRSLKSTLSVRELSKRFNCCESSIRNIFREITWKPLKSGEDSLSAEIT